MKKILVALVALFALSSNAFAEMQILTAEEPPNNYTKNGKVIGIVVDLVEALKKATGESAPIQVMPFARTYKTALETPNVLLFSES